MNGLSALHAALWGPGMLVFLLGTGLFLLIQMHFLPLRRLGFALRLALGRGARRTGQGGVSPFASLMTILAASVGTGNIVGVATALVSGGPGALVWMELSALAGLSLKLAECTLAVKYRRRDSHGTPFGGPMVVMANAFGKPGIVLGSLYSLFTLLSAFGMGSMAQSNAMSGALRSSFGLSVSLVGAVTAVLALVVILGGNRSIFRASSVLVPIMAVLYLAAGTAVLLGNLENLPAAAEQLFRCAVSPQAAAGGALGIISRQTAARWGVARGIFSNEAGLGSAAIASACADTDSPARQGYINMTSVFFDTTVLCTITGLAICVSGVLGSVDGTGSPVNGAALTILAFETVLGRWGSVFIGGSIALFAFTSIIGWAYQGEQAARFLFGWRSLLPFRVVFCLCVFWGAVAELDTVFMLADICNALMALPNLMCLLLLSRETAREILNFQG